MARIYSSQLRTERARANRALVIATATELFCTDGWVPTTMSAVATAAGLTRQTVYQQFDGKLALLDACIDNALSAGEPVRVRELPEYRAMADGDFDSRLTAGARWLRGAHERSAVIQNVLDQAAVTDPDAAERLREREANRWDEVRFAVGLVLGTEPSDRLVDSIWSLAARSIWLRLVGDRGWSESDWETWFVDLARSSMGDESAAGH
ncbi:TetR/AcrR family transcriptional regulator [Gordonia sp. OPL2]|uniref:TetR/AcrR family transcriptional regulator n=1 Tax=Gordonia sp. OPL2 TaxID=2486274 RepID=UPI00165536BF|nr:TetR/AcrR family transcriptional regulator [Gordonia sp. OPL2]RPA20116.1 TetR/AcrR family transcriptional regulator [Gordonia sp. OPL2]